MNAITSSCGMLNRFIVFFAFLLVGAPWTPVFASVAVQFTPNSGNPPLMGGSTYNITGAGTNSAISGTLSNADTTIAPTGTLTVSLVGGATSTANTQTQFDRVRPAPTVSGTTGLTEGPLYQSFGGFDLAASTYQWLTVSGVKASTWFQVRLYAYDNSYNGSMTFTDATTGSSGTTGSVNYTEGYVFTNNNDADSKFSVLLLVHSDASGNIVIKSTGLNNGNPYALLNGFTISEPALTDFKVQFTPTGGTAPLMGGTSNTYCVASGGGNSPFTGTLNGISTAVAPTGSLNFSLVGGATSTTNTQSQLTRTRPAVTVTGTGGFTEGPLYQSFGGFILTANTYQWLTVSGVQPSTWFMLELYAYDNSYTGSMTFTDVTTGSAATTASTTYTPGYHFTTNSDSDNKFSVLMAVHSDTNGNIVIQSTGINAGNTYSILNGFRLSGSCIPKVYTPTLNTAESVVAMATPQQFGAKGDGVTDDTTAFQNAINFVYHKGLRAGGVVYVPKATYAFYGNLTLPEGVTLHGDWQDWTSGTNGVQGTTFAIYTTGVATGTAFITMPNNAGGSIDGINFWYPNQSSGSITPYPFTIQMSTTGTNGIGYGNNSMLQNIVLINSYQGISQNGCEYTLSSVYGSPLDVGIFTDGGADWASMYDIKFNPSIWANSKLAGAPTANGPQATWMLANGTGMLLNRIDGENCTQVNITGYNIGVDLENNAEGKGPTAAFYAGSITGCNTAIMANTIPGQTGLPLTNMTLSGGVALSMTSTTVSPQIQIENCTLTGTSGTAITFSGVNAWNNLLEIADSTINGTVVQNSGEASIVNTTLNAATQCIMGASAYHTAFTGCTFSPSQNIVNNGTSTHLLVSATGATLMSSPVISPGINWSSVYSTFQTYQPAKTDVFAVNNYGAVGDGVNDDTSAIQTALATAGANGGGIVYLPGGHYMTTASLTVPTGVELRGPNEMRHTTGPWFDEYTGTGRPTNGHCKAAVILPTAGAGNLNGPPAVILQSTSGIRGVDFSYETQNPNNFTTSASSATAYPPSIQGQGTKVYAIACDLPNTYFGIDFDTYTCTNHFIRNIYGVDCNTFIAIGNGSSGYLVDTESQTSYWDDLDDTSSPLRYSSQGSIPELEDFTLHNSTVHLWGNMTETAVTNPSINNYAAEYCAPQSGKGPTVTGIYQTNDVSTIGFYLDGSGTMSFANTWAVVGSGTTYPELEAYQIPIWSASTFSGTFRMFNLSICGTHNIDYSVGGGDVGVQVARGFTYGYEGAQISGGTFHLIDQSTYITYTLPGNDFPAYPVNFTGPGISGEQSQVIGNFSYAGYTITPYTGWPVSTSQNFSK